jgi:hypothetical protein
MSMRRREGNFIPTCLLARFGLGLFFFKGIAACVGIDLVNFLLQDFFHPFQMFVIILS